jgi:hypothetical protein
MDPCSTALGFSRDCGEKFHSYWNFNEMDGSEDFMISDIDSESGNNDNGDGGGISS